MANLKILLNLGFVALCFALLWYLLIDHSNIAEDPRGLTAVKSEPKRIAPNPTYGKIDLDKVPYTSNDLVRPESARSTKVADEKIMSGKIYGGKKRYSKNGMKGTFFGPLKYGEPNGFGIYEYDEGDMYIGEYLDGARNEFGNSIFKATGDVQLRKYSNGKMLLKKDIWTVKYGSIACVQEGIVGKYFGPIKQANPHGYGYFEYENGDLYIGTYQNGERNGIGNLIMDTGEVIYIRYNNGKEIGRFSGNSI